MARRNFIVRLVRKTARRVRTSRQQIPPLPPQPEPARPGPAVETPVALEVEVEGTRETVPPPDRDDREQGLVDLLVWLVSTLDALRPRRVAPAWTSRQASWSRWLPLLAVAALAFVWWSTASSTAIARVAALQTVEPYAFAVHDQLVRNFAFEGQFFQTVHKGYDDAWTWSGHRALTLIAAGWAYPVEPSAFGLSRLMVVAYLAGVVPAALLGRRITRGAGVGLWVGALTYLGSPVVMALSLQDYQDLCFAAPALVFCWWAMTAKGFWWAPIGTFVGMAPREETIPMAVGLAILAVPMAMSGKVRWKRWVWNVVAAITVASIYVWWAETYFPVSGGGHDMPLENAVKGVTGGAARDIFLDGWGYLDSFYADLLLPFGLIALFGIEGVLPAAALVFLHMTVPVGHGVDRAWSGHAHHMAPAAGMMAIAASLAFGRLIRWTSPRATRKRQVVHLAWALALTAVAWQGWKPFAEEQNFRVTATAVSPEWVHPAWRLARKLPADAVPITSKDLSPVISSFSKSYTYDGSLRSKAKMEGLAAGTHMIADTRQSVVAKWALDMSGAKVVARDDPFILIAWDPGSLDKQWSKMSKAQISRPPPYVGRYNVPVHIPGVAPRVGGQKLQGIVPRLRLPWL